MDESEFEKEVEKILSENENLEARKMALVDIMEFGYYIEKDGKRLEPLTEEWWNTLLNIEKINKEDCKVINPE